MESQTKSATVYIVRHGETIGNDRRILMDPNEEVLSDTGKYQAKRLAEMTLKDVKFTQVFVSHFPRTKQTAEIILAENPLNQDLKPYVDDNLGEIDLSTSFGKPYEYIFVHVIKHLSENKPIDEFQVDGSEPVPNVRQRAGHFVNRLMKHISESTSPDETVLVVSHGALMRFMMEVLSDTNKFDIQGWDSCGLKFTRNTGLMKLSVEYPRDDKEKPKISFEKIHDFSHFPHEMLKTDSLARMVETPEGKCLSGCYQV